jgi:hypothetical protein
MPSGCAWSERDLFRVLRLVRAGNSVSAVAEMEGIHRDTVTLMVRTSAIRYLERCEQDARVERLEDLASRDP